MFETKYDKATNRIQCGEESSSRFGKEPKNNTVKGKKLHQDKNTQQENNTKHQQVKPMTSRDIMTRVKNGEMTHKQAEIKFEKERFSRKKL